MKTIANFIDEGLARIGLKSQNQLALALGYENSGLISLIYHGKRAVPDNLKTRLRDHLQIPEAEWGEYERAVTAARIEQKNDLQDDYARIARETERANQRVAALSHLLGTVVLIAQDKGVEFPQDILDSIQALVDGRDVSA